MKEISFIGPEMAMEHAAFQAFKHINYNIGIIAPQFDMLSRARRDLEFNVKSIDSNCISKITERTISLANGSNIYCMSKSQGSKSFRGMSYNIIMVMFEPLEHEMKLELIPALACNQGSILYTVYDR